MALTAAQVILLNNMCISAQNVSLGTAIQTLETAEAGVARGTHLVTAGEETAGTLDIVTGLAAIVGFVVQVYRADILLDSYTVTAATGTLTVADNSTTYVVTENDVINYIAY